MSNTPWRGVGVLAGAIATILIAAGRSDVGTNGLLWGLAIFGVLALTLLVLNAWDGRRRNTPGAKRPNR